MTEPAPDGVKRVDDALIAQARADRARATSPGEIAALDRLLDLLPARIGMPLDQLIAETHAQVREAEADRDTAQAQYNKLDAVLGVVKDGYSSVETPGPFSLRAVTAPAPQAYPATAGQVLEHHTRLHGQLANPPPAVTGLIRYFAEEYADKAGTGNWLSKFMYWPYYVGGQQPRANWDTKFAGAIARGLFSATTYQVTAEMCDIAEAMYEQTAKVNGQLAASDLPSECGFLWLDKPFSRADAGGDSYHTRVVTWSPQSSRMDGVTRDGVRVTLWIDWQDHEFPLLMVGTMVVPFGEDFGGVHDDGVPTPLHYVHAVWLLLGTEVAVISRGGVPRHVRKRAQGSIKQHEVQVVTLRRAIHQTGDREETQREIDWSCRWLVRGFWRHQWGHGTVGHPHDGQPDGVDPPHCRACGAQITWVRPYVKGPDDRPLKATRTLYRLSR